MINTNINLSTAKAYRTSSLPTLSQSMQEDDEERNLTHGIDITISADEWKTPTNRKWLGFCKVLRRRGVSDASLNIQYTSVRMSTIRDVTICGETEETVTQGFHEELSKDLNSSNDRVVAVVTDSAGCNMKAKRNLTAMYYIRIVSFDCVSPMLCAPAQPLCRQPP